MDVITYPCDNLIWYMPVEEASGLRPANERRRYKVTPSLVGWSPT